jgi:ABC-type transport system involved in cytochrome bd biosynthesis fused ATPase/permease subunit
LDEATGALYSEEEEKFNCRSERDVKKRVIGMTHQLSITARMECIVLMNNWSIVNQC